MIKHFRDLTILELEQLADAWLPVTKALAEYERITGATELDGQLYDAIWQIIEDQANEYDKSI